MNSNPFPEMSQLPVNMKGPVQSEQKKRFGVMRAAIGANFAVRCRDGKVRAFTVRDAESFAKRLDEIKKDKKESQPHHICFHASCRGRKWDTEEALLGDHPDIKVMQQQEEAHVIAIWCDAPEFADAAVLKTWHENEASQSALGARVKRDDPIVGLLSPS